MSKDKRVKVNLNNDSYITVNLEQEVDQLRVLSLSLSQDDIYADFNANFGVIVGRVIANGGVGVPNVKVSVFVPIQEEDTSNELLLNEYNYITPNDVGRKGKRYNLLNRIRRLTGFSLNKKQNGEDDLWDVNRHMAGFTPKRIIGDFPEKIEVLQNNTKLEVYKKYYKYTTITNHAGDYLLYGVPLGQQTVHIDADLSDIGELSLTPASFKAQGYPDELFDGSKFKPCNNLDECIQLESQNITVNVRPFWGDRENFEIGLTRQDFNLRKSLFPTFVVFGAAPAMDKDTWWGDRVIFRLVISWLTLVRENSICFCVRIRIPVINRDLTIIPPISIFPFPICFPAFKFLFKSKYNAIKGGYYNLAPFSFTVLRYKDENNRGGIINITSRCCGDSSIGCTEFVSDEDACGDTHDGTLLVTQEEYQNVLNGFVSDEDRFNVNGIANANGFPNGFNTETDGGDYGIIPCFPKKEDWLSGTTYTAGTETSLLKYQPSNPASTIYTGSTSFRLNTTFPLLRDTDCNGEPGWTYPTPNSVNTSVSIVNFPDYTYFRVTAETVAVSYTPRECVSVYTASTLTNLQNLNKNPSSTVVVTGNYTNGTSVNQIDFFDASFNQFSNSNPLRFIDYWQLTSIPSVLPSWDMTTVYNVGDTVISFINQYIAVDIFLLDKLNTVNKTLTNINIPPEAPSANTYVTLVFDDLSTENGIVLTTGEIRIVYITCGGGEVYEPFSTPRFITSFWEETSLEIPDWSKSYVTPLNFTNEQDQDDERDTEGTDKVKFINSQNYPMEFEVYSNIGDNTEKEFVRVNPRAFEAYIDAGQFAIRIPCDRRRMITSETGELIDSPDDTIGVFTEFDGYMFTKPTIEAGSTGVSDKAAYVTLKIPQTVSIFNNYEQYRTESQLFKFGRYYSVAQRFGNRNGLNNHYVKQGSPQIRIDDSELPNLSCNRCHVAPGGIDLTPFANPPQPNAGFDFYDGMGDVLFRYKQINDELTCFWDEWINFTVFHYNFIYRIRKNRGKSRYNPYIYGGELWYDEDEKDVGDNKTNRNFISNGSFINTSFVEVPKNDILVVLDRTVNLNNETITAFKGFAVPSNGTLFTSKNGIQIENGTLEGYSTYKANNNQYKFFYVGAKNKNVFKYIKDLELI